MAFAEHLTSPAFKENAKGALADPQLQSALHGVETGVVDRRRATVEKLPEFQALRDSARDVEFTGRDEETGFGLLDVQAAVKGTARPPEASCD